MNASHIRTTSSKLFTTIGSAAICLAVCLPMVAQNPTPTPTPTDKRGFGIQNKGVASSTQSNQQGKEDKPELVLQTGYSNVFGATRLVFSPDGKLLATGTFRSSSIKLWETASGRKLRELSTGSQSSVAISPVI